MADAVEKAVNTVLEQGILPRDLNPENAASTSAVGDAVVRALQI